MLFAEKLGSTFRNKKISSLYNSNYFIILPNNSNRVSLKLKSSEANLVWSNLKRVETCYVTSARTKTFFASIEFQNSRGQVVRHVAMVANFLYDNKLETSLKKRIRTVSNFIDLIQFHLICQMLATFSGGESERTSSKFRARAHEIRKFHVAVVQPRLRNVQKSVMQCKVVVLLINLLLCLLFSLPSPSSLLKLPIVVIHKFCYHGNVTSHWPLSIGPVLLSKTIFRH